MVYSRCIAVVCLFVIVLLSAGAAAADDLTDCHQLIGSMRYSACSRVIARSATATADRAQALGSRSTILIGRGETARAIADLEEAIRLDPSSGWTEINKGLLAQVRGNRDEAFRRFDAAIARDPKNARAFNVRGVAYRRQGDLDRAIADYTEAIILEPANPLPLANRGLALGAKGQVDAAIADFELALRVRPAYSPALNGLGWLNLRKGERDKAKAYLDRAIASDPDMSAAYYNRATYHNGLGQYAAAIADLDVAATLDPTNAIVFNDRGYSHSKIGQADRALADYESALRLNPKLLIALNNRGLAYTVHGQRELALADFKAVLALPASGPGDKQRQEAAHGRIARLQKELSSLPDQPHAPRRHSRVALVIGNSAYTHVAGLGNPTNDAKGVAAALRRLGFTSVVELIDATRDQMGTAIKEFGDVSEGVEWAIVYFAGHGIEINGTSYLIPVDAALKRDTHVDDEAIPLSRVMAKVDAASRIGLVILDACRNNPFASRMTRSGGATRSIGNGLAPVEPDGNVLVAYAAKHGTVAEDGTTQHSPFTEALLEYVEQPGLEINFLFRKVRDSVRKRTDRRQDPFVYGSLGSDPLYLRSASPR